MIFSIALFLHNSSIVHFHHWPAQSHCSCTVAMTLSQSLKARPLTTTPHPMRIKSLFLSSATALLFAVTSAQQADDHSQPTVNFFGLVKSVQVDLLSAADLQKSASSVQRFQARLESPGALSLAAHFDELAGIREGQLTVRGEDGETVIVPIPEEMPEDTGLVTPYVAGSVIFIELRLPAEQAQAAKALIDHLVHDQKGIFKREPVQKSASAASAALVAFPTYNIANQCTNDAICSQADGYGNQRRSVAQYFFRYNENVYASCSGVMLNTAQQTGTQYLLSAEQCIQFSRPRWLREATVLFNYQRRRCNDESESQPYYGDQVRGLSVITASSQTDMVLFTVNERIPDSFNVYLAGWDARRRMFNNVIAFNYPLADVKKVVRMRGCLGPLVAYGPATYGSRIINYDQPYFYQMIPTSGRSWAGSTGGPLFSDWGLVIGQLSQIVSRSSSNQCATREFYGAFAASYFNLGTQSLINFLNPDNFPDLSINGIYLNDARNSGLLKSTRGGALAINGGSDDSSSSSSSSSSEEDSADKKKDRKDKKKDKKKKKKKGKKGGRWVCDGDTCRFVKD